MASSTYISRRTRAAAYVEALAFIGVWGALLGASLCLYPVIFKPELGLGSMVFMFAWYGFWGAVVLTLSVRHLRHLFALIDSPSVAPSAAFPGGETLVHSADREIVEGDVCGVSEDRSA